MKQKYNFFPFVLFRSPLYPYNISDNEARLNDMFMEGLFLASPDLYHEMKMKNKSERIKISLEKYYSRAKTRPTPFGLFAGCSLGYICGDRTEIELEQPGKYKRTTRLDMQCLCELIQNIEKQDAISSQLKYFPNNSLYRIGEEYRYIEYYYHKTHRFHQIISIKKNTFLTQVLKKAKNGVVFSELVEVIKQNNFSQNEACAYIKQIISSQILKSELEIAVTGEDPLSILLNKLKRLNNVDHIVDIISQIIILLKHIDNNNDGDNIKYYLQIENLLRQTTYEFDPKYLFQTDLFKPTIKASVSNLLTDEIFKVISFLNKVTLLPKHTNLTEFIKEFSKRYPDQEMDLNFVLDTETGIGYPINQGQSDNSPLIDDLYFPIKTNTKQYDYTVLTKVIGEKYIQCLKQQQNTIILNDEDFPTLEADWQQMPATFSVICSIVSDNENQKQILFKAVGGHSAGYLLGRFGHLDSSIELMLSSIANKEQALEPDAILAEIVHLPEARTGNVIFRPAIRKYEIPYLANSSVNSEQQIPLSDLSIAIQSNRVILKSKKLKKEIIPRLTNAHNYAYNSMPIYHFLCDLQNQNKKTILHLDIENYFSNYRYFPRITYRNHILSKERWLINSKELEGYMSLPDDKLLAGIENFRLQNNIPQRVVIQEGDNELYIDLNNIISVKTLLSMSKSRKELRIEEFIFDSPNAIVKSKNNFFTNEFIFTLFRS